MHSTRTRPTQPTCTCAWPQIHGNICMDAVTVTDTLDWKLHGFDLLSEHALPVGDTATHVITMEWS